MAIPNSINLRDSSDTEHLFLPTGDAVVKNIHPKMYINNKTKEGFEEYTPSLPTVGMTGEFEPN